MDIRFKFFIHIYYKKEYFDTFLEKKTNVDYFSNRSTCDAMGVGMVKIKMFDGVIRTLNSVTYVLNM